MGLRRLLRVQRGHRGGPPDLAALDWAARIGPRGAGLQGRSVGTERAGSESDAPRALRTG